MPIVFGSIESIVAGRQMIRSIRIMTAVHGRRGQKCSATTAKILFIS